jgi:signal transduction histidine kinase
MPNTPSHNRFREGLKAFALDWAWLGFLALALAVANVSVELLSQYSSNVGSIWLANGVIAAAVLRTQTSRWGLVTGVAFAMLVAGELMMENSPRDALVFSAINIIEVLIVVVPLRAAGLDRDIAKPANLLAFYLLAVVPATLTSSLLSSLYLHAVEDVPFGSMFPIWYASSAMGMVAVAPLGAVLNFSDFGDFFRWRKLPGNVGLMLAFAGTLGLMRALDSLPLGFIFFPVFLLFVVFRGYAGLAVAVVSASLATFMNLMSNRGYLAVSSMTFEDKLVMLQIFVGVLALTSMFFASVLAERRKLIRQLQDASTAALAARDAAEHANRAKSNFLASMSHELRTPLNAILGYSEIMRDGVLKRRCEGECRDHARTIHGAGSHLLSLINDILDMSKIEAGKFDLYLEPVDLRVAVSDCVGLMEARAKLAGLTLVADLPAEPEVLQADGRAIRQIVLNLLSNAIKFTPSGGTVSVHLGRGEGKVTLAVRDTGVGIAAKDLPRLGIPFEQVRHSPDVAHSGTGLGLALVSALAQKHGGSMKIESEEGAGTLVTITLPLVRQEPATEVAAQAAE